MKALLWKIPCNRNYDDKIKRIYNPIFTTDLLNEIFYHYISKNGSYVWIVIIFQNGSEEIIKKLVKEKLISCGINLDPENKNNFYNGYCNESKKEEFAWFLRTNTRICFDVINLNKRGKINNIITTYGGGELYVYNSREYNEFIDKIQNKLELYDCYYKNNMTQSDKQKYWTYFNKIGTNGTFWGHFFYNLIMW